MLAPAPIAAKKAGRAKDPVAATIAAAARAGARFRWLGDALEVAGPPEFDWTQLEGLLPEIEDRLRPPDQDGGEELLEVLDIEVELITDRARAAEVVADLPAEVGLDLETMPRGPLQEPWIEITRSGKRAAHQSGMGDAPLDPFRGQPRLIDVYDPSRRTIFLFDVAALGGCPDGLLERRVVGHNLLFDLAMLGAQGLAPTSAIDTLQIAAMILPPGGRGLEEVAGEALGFDVSKAMQRSNWAAPRLSTAQLAYAGADPALAFLAGKRLYARLEERERQAFAVANRAVPAIVRMRLRGLPFDVATHAEVIRGWEAEFAARRTEFEELTGSEAPTSTNAIRAWLTSRLPDDALLSWKRTDSGLLSTEAAEINRRALDWPEARPLLDLRKAQTKLQTFGSSLIALASPATGRLHGDYHLPMVTGRMSCSRPNLQNLPTDARRAVRVPEGRVLIAGDLNQIELRTAAELSGDENMRAAFVAGEDLHARFARMMIGERYDQLPEDQRKMERKKAKAGHFGNLFAQSVSGFRKYAWKQFDLDLTMDEAAAICDAFYETYPAIGPYQQDQFRQGRWGVLYSVAGRPRRACWEKEGVMWLQLCANYAVQSSAADVLLEAMHRVDRALPGTLVAAVHDELVLEVDEARAGHAGKVLEEEMTVAFRRWFPEAPTPGLVDVKVVSVWADAKD